MIRKKSIFYWKKIIFSFRNDKKGSQSVQLQAVQFNFKITLFLVHNNEMSHFLKNIFEFYHNTDRRLTVFKQTFWRLVIHYHQHWQTNTKQAVSCAVAFERQYWTIYVSKSRLKLINISSQHKLCVSQDIVKHTKNKHLIVKLYSKSNSKQFSRNKIN